VLCSNVVTLNNYPGFAENSIAIGPNWGLYQLRMQAKMAIDIGEGAVTLHLGGANQVIEIGQAYLIKEPPPTP
jgi:hypothetical protein